MYGGVDETCSNALASSFYLPNWLLVQLQLQSSTLMLSELSIYSFFTVAELSQPGTVCIIKRNLDCSYMNLRNDSYFAYSHTETV